MKTKCKVIEDLLPLYIDKICSDDSRKLVEEHILECSECHQKYENMTKEILPEELLYTEYPDLTEQVKKKSISTAAFTGKKAFQKIRRFYFFTILIILAAIPNILLSIHQVKGVGISYTNIDDVFRANRMFSYIKKGKYEKAFQYFDIKARYKEIMELDTALSLPQAYSAVTIDGAEYYITEEVRNNEYKAYQANRDVNAFWLSIYQRRHYILPEKVYLQLVSEHSELATFVEKNSYAVLLSSKYGKYNIPLSILEKYLSSLGETEARSSLDGTEALESIASDRGICILPAKLYQVTMEEEKQEMNEIVAYREKYNTMGYEKFYSLCKNNFIRKLKQLEEQHVTISDIKLDTIYAMENNRYQLEYNLYFITGENEKNKIGITISEQEGNIDFIGGISGSDESEAMENKYQLRSAFYISAE
jgi:Predicted integral membrane protein